MDKLFRIILTALCLLPATLVSAQSIVVSQDFEGNVFPPQGWLVVDNDGDGHCWQLQSGTSYVTHYSGSKQLAISYCREPGAYSQTYGEQDNWLISPEIDVTNDQFVAEFVYAAQDLEQTERIALLVSESGSAPADFTELWSSTADNGYEDDIQWSSKRQSLAKYNGKKIRLAIRHKSKNTYGLSIDNFFVYNQNGPKQPTFQSAKAATDGKKEITLTWTNPSQTAAGVALTDLSIVIYRDGVQLIELTDRTPGASDSYIDTTTDGTHIYCIAAKNSEGEGAPTAKRSVYLGEDIAKAVSETTAITDSEGNIVLTWTAPTKGVNNGYLNTAAMTYKVYRGGSLIASEIADCRYVDENPAQGFNEYYVTAVTGGGESAIDYKAGAYVADPSKMDVRIAQTAERDNSLARLPVDLSSKYSVSQIIYFPEDFNFFTGDISEIVLKAFHGTDSPMEIKGMIYLTPTTLTELNDWAPVAESDKVYQGIYTVRSGANDVVIQLDRAYSYKGGNLVMTFIKDGAPSGGYSDRFLSVKTDKQNRSFTTTAYDPINIADLPHSTYSDKHVNELPSTRFIMTAKGVTSLSGKITTGADNTPVEGVKVAADGYEGLAAFTDAEGQYSFKYIPVNVTSLTLTKVGYEDASINVTLTEGEAAVANAVISRHAFFTLSGKVTTKDTGMNAAGGEIVISGYENLNGVIAEDGTWSIDGIYVGKDYTLTVKYPLYDLYTADFKYTEDGNKEYQPIVLDRALIPAWNVEAIISEDGSKANLSWNDPTERDSEAGMKSIGDVSTVKSDSGDYYSTVYNVAHHFSTQELEKQKMVGLVVDSERVYIKADKGVFTAKVWKGTKTKPIEVASQPIPAESITAEGSWITVKFDNPAEIKPGDSYMIGVEAKNASSYPFGTAASSSIDGGNNVKWGDSPYSGNGYSAWCIEAYCKVPGTDVDIVPNPDAPKCNYNVFRGVIASDGETEWTKLTPSPISELSYTDADWSTGVAGKYVYGVSAVYNKVGESVKALSDNISRAVNKDVAVTSFISPVKSVESRDNVNVIVKIENFGELPASDIPVELTINGGDPVKVTYDATLNKGESAEVTLGEVTLIHGLNVIVAATALEGDESDANNALTLELPNFDNINLSGYRWDAYGTAGFMDFGSNNPEGATYKVEVTPNDALIISGEAINGKFYGYTATWWGEPREFVEIDLSNWVVERALSNTDSYVLDMAYDYSSDTMYCIMTDYERVALGTVDIATGVATPEVLLENVMRALACSLDGKLYSIDESGNFYSIDPSTGKTTLIGNTGAGNAAYLQSMAFDHNTERLFWAQTNAYVSGNLHEINPENGKATSLGTVMYLGSDPSEIVGLYSVYTVPPKSFGVVSTDPADNSGMQKFASVSLTFDSEVTADRTVLSQITFSEPVAGWSIDGDGTAQVTLRPLDKNGNPTEIEFEFEKSYTLTIPAATFLKPNGDYNEALTLTFISTVSGIEMINGDEEGARWFDLRGIEVKTPTPGELNIRVNPDGTTSKTLFGK